VTHLFIEPGQLNRGNVLNKLRDGLGDVRRQDIISRHQRQDIRHNPNVA
jgi:hypothetical protein